MNVEWTEQEFERAKELWQKGERARIIAETLGKTKNAVLAKLHRANAHQRDVEPAYLRHYYKPKNTERKHPARAKPVVVAAPPPQPVAPEPQSEPNPIRCVTIRRLRRNSCRYPMSDDPRTTPPSKFLYCGAQITHGAYCQMHAQLAYIPLRGRGVSAEREMMRMIVQPTKPADEPKLLDRDVA